MSDTLMHARRLVLQYGFSIIPVHAGSKVPAIPTWAAFQQARPTEDNLTAWFPEGQPKNIGVVCGAVSSLVVLDSDTTEGETWAQGHVPATPFEVITAKGK